MNRLLTWLRAWLWPTARGSRSRALVQVVSGQIADSAITLSHLASDVLARLNWTPSATTAVAVTGLTVTARVQRIAGDGGPVTVTATPSIAAGAYDGQLAVLQGTSDTNTVTFQDAAQLANSGLHLVNARDMTLGKNDTLMLLYDADQDLWIELHRADSY